MVTLEPMSELRLRPWFEAGEQDYVADLVQAGKTPDQIRRTIQHSFEDYFPGGVPAPGHLVFDVLHDGEPVGYVWIGPQSDGDEAHWWLWDLAIDEPHRRHGFARAALVRAEEAARGRGARSLGLKVFGFNTGARALYASLGYQTVTLQMTKPLVPPGLVTTPR